MECERDLLVNASCPGFHALINMPCVGDTMAWPARASAEDFSRQVQGMSHPTLKGRIARVLECKAYYQVNLWMIHAFKPNKTYAFMEVTILLEEKPGQRPRLINLVITGQQICFFLGTYPNYWSRKENRLLWVSAFPWPPNPMEFWAIGTTPFIPGIDMGIFTQLDPSRWEHYVSAENIKTYKSQKATLDYYAAWQKECLRKNYPPEEVKPKRIVSTPKGPGTYDLPMSEITPPVIDAAAQTEDEIQAGAWPRPRLWLTFWQPDQNTLSLTIDSPAA